MTYAVRMNREAKTSPNPDADLEVYGSDAPAIQNLLAESPELAANVHQALHTGKPKWSRLCSHEMLALSR